MSRFFNEKYTTLKPYVLKQEKEQNKLLRLNTNESPYAPSPFVYRSIDQFEVDNLRLYSDLGVCKLIKAIAENFNVAEEQVAVGNGSGELLSFAFMAFQNNAKKFYFPNISYELYSAYADIVGAEKVEIPVKSDLSINPTDYFNLDGTIIISNPNTPTGMALTLAEIEQIVSTNNDNLVVIDEAYVDFGAESCVSLIPKYDNLLVMQTFSKSRNLAGARVGFAIGSPEIIADLNKIKDSFNPYNINRLSIIAGTAAMKDKDYFKKSTNDIKKTREKFTVELEELGFTVLNSSANFLFVKNPEVEGEAYFRALQEKNILVKHYDRQELKDYVRITIGTSNDMMAVLKATKAILGIEERRGE